MSGDVSQKVIFWEECHGKTSPFQDLLLVKYWISPRSCQHTPKGTLPREISESREGVGIIHPFAHEFSAFETRRYPSSVHDHDDDSDDDAADDEDDEDDKDEDKDEDEDESRMTRMMRMTRTTTTAATTTKTTTATTTTTTEFFEPGVGGTFFS